MLAHARLSLTTKTLMEARWDIFQPKSNMWTAQPTPYVEYARPGVVGGPQIADHEESQTQ